MACQKQSFESMIVLSTLILSEYWNIYLDLNSTPSTDILELSKNCETPFILQLITLTPSHFQPKSSEFIMQSFNIRFEQFLHALTPLILQLTISIFWQYHIDDLEFASKIVLHKVILWQCHMQ